MMENYSFLLFLAGLVLFLLALLFMRLAYKVAMADSNVYEANRRLIPSFWDGLSGRVSTFEPNSLDKRNARTSSGMEIRNGVLHERGKLTVEALEQVAL